MEKMKCDVVIIGSGIGGLCAGANLAHAGLRVIMLEKFPILGGRYTYLDYKGYKVNTAAWIVGFGKDSPVYRTLKEVGAPDIEMRGAEIIRYRIDGKGYDIPLNERGGLKRVIQTASKDKDESERVMDAVRKGLRWQEPSDSISFKDWLLQYTDNQKIHNIFNAQSTAWSGINIHEYPAGEFIRALKHSVTRGGFLLPINGLKDVIDALERAIKKNRGEIFTETEVVDIGVRDGVAVGVVADSKEGRVEVEADVVISNVGPVKTIQLAKEENFDKGYLKEVRERIRPAVGMHYVFSSDRPLLDFSGLLYTTDTRRMTVWMTMTQVWPHWAPEGKHLTFGFAVPESALIYNPSKEYEIFFLDLKDLFPKFEEYGGELLSVGNFCGNWPLTRSWQGYMMGTKTPIEKLYNVGDAMNPPGFICGEGAAESGCRVAEQIKTELR